MLSLYYSVMSLVNVVYKPMKFREWLNFQESYVFFVNGMLT